MVSELKAINVLFSDKKERDRMHRKAVEAGFESASSYLKFCGFNARIKVEIGKYPIVENLATLRELYIDGQISHDELLKIKSDIMQKDSKSLMEAHEKSKGVIVKEKKKRRSREQVLIAKIEAENGE